MLGKAFSFRPILFVIRYPIVSVTLFLYAGKYLYIIRFTLLCRLGR